MLPASSSVRYRLVVDRASDMVLDTNNEAAAQPRGCGEQTTLTVSVKQQLPWEGGLLAGPARFVRRAVTDHDINNARRVGAPYIIMSARGARLTTFIFACAGVHLVRLPAAACELRSSAIAALTRGYLRAHATLVRLGAPLAPALTRAPPALVHASCLSDVGPHAPARYGVVGYAPGANLI